MEAADERAEIPSAVRIRQCERRERALFFLSRVDCDAASGCMLALNISVRIVTLGK